MKEGGGGQVEEAHLHPMHKITNQAPIHRRTLSVSAVSSPPEYQHSERMCKCCPCRKTVPK